MKKYLLVSIVAVFLAFGVVLRGSAESIRAPVPNGAPSYAGAGAKPFAGAILATGREYVLDGSFYPAAYLPPNALVEFEDRAAGLFRITRDVPIFTMTGTIILKHTPGSFHNAAVTFYRLDDMTALFWMSLYTDEDETGTIALTVPLYLYETPASEMVFRIHVWQDYHEANGVMVNLRFSP